MRKLKVGVVGLGFIGSVHIDAVNRSPFAEVSAICDSNLAFAQKAAERWNIQKVYDNYQALIADPDIDVIHNCTPNFLHFEINQMALEHGKHILCEKPLGMTSEETGRLLEIAKQYPKQKTMVNFNYRMYPLIQEYKQRIQHGELGTPKLVHGRYLQDWLLYDTDFSWRLDPKVGGQTRAVSDIGSHWCDLAETLLGSRITDVMADLITVIPVRKKPLGQVTTFASANAAEMEYEDYPVHTEDYACVMLRFENGTKGVFYVSQVSAGHKCDLSIEIDTDQTSLFWAQQENEKMWHGFRDEPNRTEWRNPGAFCYAKSYTSLPGGHPEGFHDAFSNQINAFYRSILKPEAPIDYATFEDGHHIMKVIDAIVESDRQKKWIEVET